MARRAHAHQPRRPAGGNLQILVDDAVRAFQRGDDAHVIAACERLLAGRKDQPDALNLLGMAYQRTGRGEDAIAALTRAAEAAPRNSDIRNNLGVALASQSHHDRAAAAFESALRRNPGDPEIRANLGRAFAALGRWRNAVEQFRLACRAKPPHAGLLADAARACRMAGEIMEAERLCRSAIAAAPADPRPHAELAVILRATGRRRDALAEIERVAAAQPGAASRQVDRGLLLAECARYEDALDAFDRALALSPDCADARFGRALVNLLLGRFAPAWADYRWRESMRDPAMRDSAAAAGRGFHRMPLPGRLDGKRVVVVSDQGLGDEIFFLRFMPALAARGATIAYRPDPRLAGMIGRARLVDAVVDKADAAGADYTVSIGDLPYLLGSGDGVPPSIRLTPLPEKLDEIRQRLAACGGGPYIGVTWRAGTIGGERVLQKSMPPNELGSALALVPGTLLVLQRSPLAGEIAALTGAAGRPAHDLSALNPELESMLALAGLLDLYVTVSNTNLHLRAAQDRACHVLVPAPPEFRWMAEGRESPWFPGSPVYRQQGDGNWRPALAALARDLGSSPGS